MKPTDLQLIESQKIMHDLIAVIYKDLRTGTNSVRFFLESEIASASTEIRYSGIEKLIEERADRNDDESDQCETVSFQIDKEITDDIKAWCREKDVSWSAISVGLSKFCCDPAHFAFLCQLLDDMKKLIKKEQMKEDRTSGPII